MQQQEQQEVSTCNTQWQEGDGYKGYGTHGPVDCPIAKKVTKN